MSNVVSVYVWRTQSWKTGVSMHRNRTVHRKNWHIRIRHTHTRTHIEWPLGVDFWRVRYVPFSLHLFFFLLVNIVCVHWVSATDKTYQNRIICSSSQRDVTRLHIYWNNLTHVLSKTSSRIDLLSCKQPAKWRTQKERNISSLLFSINYFHTIRILFVMGDRYCSLLLARFDIRDPSKHLILNHFVVFI